MSKITPLKLDRLDTEAIIAFAIKKNRSFVLAHPDYQPTKTQAKKIRSLLTRRALGEPFAYLTGHKEFFGLDFLVDKRVLVPRPETELLVEEVIKIIADKGIKQKIALIDIGTGSGCIPIATTKNIIAPISADPQHIKLIATDISKTALTVAKKNAKKHHVKIKFVLGNLLAPIINKPSLLPTNYSNIIITANLPYGWKAWKNNCSMETRGLKFEPAQALFTDKQGLGLYEKLFKQLQSLLLLTPCSLLLLIEFDPRQTSLLKKLIKKHLPKASVEIKKDLAGKDRLAIIKTCNLTSS